jgi:hypothetical protein
MAYEIETGVPIPKTRASGRAETIKKLEIGQSFVCQGLPNATSAQICLLGRKLGRKFVQRRIDDTSYRIWRIE